MINLEIADRVLLLQKLFMGKNERGGQIVKEALRRLIVETDLHDGYDAENDDDDNPFYPHDGIGDSEDNRDINQDIRPSGDIVARRTRKRLEELFLFNNAEAVTLVLRGGGPLDGNHAATRQTIADISIPVKRLIEFFGNRFTIQKWPEIGSRPAKRLPALLYEHGWSCSEAVPLHTWIDQLTVTQFALHTERNRELLESVADIEDAAVKRIPIDWYKMAEFLDNAAKLTEVLQTKEHSDYIKRIRVDIEVAIRDLRDQEQKAQEDERLERLQILSEQERLRYRERLARKEKERKIRECRHSAGLKVMRALGKDKRDEF
ncbi:uncharacterized protein FPRO_14754 [Fusarium proliferatum ET1]|uniref:Uncharacterized protein n=1 Tax=Fusarium proliferatum (strain ET1) TaxID=1227346 RepID=A0A1L7WAX0_FUSPR|nr:uncharacterized protein FPRO_14754 [Fusarium proliferatum ET1]CZR49769.1 uncharacterized protein FPRO_14754 [Fusarium proliferatum ET1]